MVSEQFKFLTLERHMTNFDISLATGRPHKAIQFHLNYAWTDAHGVLVDPPPGHEHYVRWVVEAGVWAHIPTLLPERCARMGWSEVMATYDEGVMGMMINDLFKRDLMLGN